MKRVSILGVLVGGVVDIVSTNVFTFPVMVFAIMRIDSSHIPKAQLTTAMMTLMRTDASLMIAAFFAGFAGSLLAGYVAAAIAKHDETFNGTLSAWLCVALGIYGWKVTGTTVPTLYHLSGFVMSPAIGALGGYGRLLQRQLASRKLHASG